MTFFIFRTSSQGFSSNYLDCCRLCGSDADIADAGFNYTVSYNVQIVPISLLTKGLEYFNNVQFMGVLTIGCDLIQLHNIIYQNRNIMMRDNRSMEASSEGDKASFDFLYKIDISERRNKAQGLQHQESGYDFENFPDIRQDKSQKSFMTSYKKVLPSQLAKRTQQSFLLAENATELSIMKKNNSFLDEYDKSSGVDQKSKSKMMNTSPKFTSNNYGTTDNFYNQSKQPEPEQTYNSNMLKFQKQPWTPLQVATNLGSPMPSQPKHLPFTTASPRNSPTALSKLSTQSEYKQLVSTIQYLESENKRLQYEIYTKQKQTSQFQTTVNSRLDREDQIAKIIEETQVLNGLIKEEREIERVFIENRKRMQEEYDDLVASIEGMRFERPQVIRDESKAIIDEIYSLKAEFESLRRDNSSLNLSHTMETPELGMHTPKFPLRLSQSPSSPASPGSPAQHVPTLPSLLSQLALYAQTQPYYLYNTKMLALRDEWKLFENAEICVNCCTRDYPMLELRVGNKSLRSLTGFGLKDGQVWIAKGETLQAKSYYVHRYERMRLELPFLKLELSYSISNLAQKQAAAQPKSVALFIPTLPLKHGQFIPITSKQYQQEKATHIAQVPYIQLPRKPLDRAIIKQNISQLVHLFPNLLYELSPEGEHCCKGLFRLWNTGEGCLVEIQQKGACAGVTLYGQVRGLGEALQFIINTIL